MSSVTTKGEWVAVGAHSASTGSIRVANTQFEAGSTTTVGSGPEQCLPASPGKHAVYAEAYIGGGQGAGFAAINVQFFKQPDCTMSLGAFQTPETRTSNVWSVVSGAGTAPTETKAIKLRLVLGKSLGQPSLTAAFDHVLVKHVIGGTP
jgi:hypothetical protein